MYVAFVHPAIAQRMPRGKNATYMFYLDLKAYA